MLQHKQQLCHFQAQQQNKYQEPHFQNILLHLKKFCYHKNYSDFHIFLMKWRFLSFLILLLPKKHNFHYCFLQPEEKLIQHFNKKKDNEYIRVYTRDGSADRIENGATVLDLAFRIHTNLGLRFDYAKINGTSHHYPASTQLNDEDSVIIVGRDTVTADLQWFRYLKTDQAIDKLIKYFKNSIDQYVWLTENASRN